MKTKINLKKEYENMIICNLNEQFAYYFCMRFIPSGLIFQYEIHTKWAHFLVQTQDNCSSFWLILVQKWPKNFTKNMKIMN